jgi:hypothetical protein
MIENDSQLIPAAFGKIIFIPLHKHKSTLPPLPDMSLLFFNNKEDTMFPWRAVCIELEFLIILR